MQSGWSKESVWKLTAAAHYAPINGLPGGQPPGHSPVTPGIFLSFVLEIVSGWRAPTVLSLSLNNPGAYPRALSFRVSGHTGQNYSLDRIYGSNCNCTLMFFYIAACVHLCNANLNDVYKSLKTVTFRRKSTFPLLHLVLPSFFSWT